ncbi:MAG: tRNA (adenosine(37)-N6)-dimethylallyltransferase MiaA [Acidobacteriota bacterium]|nr:MAG: tRNA (adenosine(37)-N6)-dimethylallyltransferase MiaA [Acidobacteriota bacterium]
MSVIVSDVSHMATKRCELVAIVGPTGVGKSELALEVARELDAEIVNCDALQVYRGLDIGTGKVRPSGQRGIPHHLISVISPDEEFSAASYIARAAPVIDDIAERGKLPLVVGGTGLYLRALLRGLFDGPGRSPEVRERLGRIAARRGTRGLHRMLKRWDPVSAERVHPNDRVRLERALEVRIQTGRPMSALMRERVSPIAEFQVILIGLEPNKSALALRIGRRVARMFDEGFASEVRELRKRYGENIPAFKAIGYRETLGYLSGEIDLRRAQELITIATSQYAKRQMTWFRGEKGIEWFRGSGDDPLVLESVLRYLLSQARQGQQGQQARRQNQETLHAETAS